MIDALMNQAVAQGAIPGGVVLVGHNGQVVYRKAFGMRSLEPVREPMTMDTVFDLASLTKCVATATSVSILLQEGKLRLNDPVATYLPEFAQKGKGSVTIRQLLTHYSGLPEDLDLRRSWQGRETGYRLAMEERLVYPTGTRFVYSDVNYIVLGQLVEKLSGQSLETFARQRIFAPLGMRDTGFTPAAALTARIAPTEYDGNHRMLRGVVHDPTARRMGGVAGHAGLFSTADDLARFAQDLLTGFRVLTPLTVAKMSAPQQPPTGTVLRGIGWDIDSPYSSNRGEFLPVGSFGHTGFTGTSLWIDPSSNTYIIVLTNAVHPHDDRVGSVSLRSRIASVAAQALNLELSSETKRKIERITGYNEALAGARSVTVRNGQVKTGIDVLARHHFAELRQTGKAVTRVALVTNQTGIDAGGRRTIDLLAHTEGVQLAAIFSPEHGIEGKLDTTAISNGRDAATGVPVYSVYGETSEQRRPSAEVVRSVDAIVFDIADVGTRFYTYETTLGYFLEVAAAENKKIYVLDRPNPITGAMVQGPTSEAGREDFIDYGPIPLRHGLTMGELARYWNGERKIGAPLTVVAMEGWMRGDWLDATGVEWVNPSPNMRTLTAALLYPGLGILEATNLSLGRGTDRPFELLGAPWIKAGELAGYLNCRAIPGVRFVPLEFTPQADVYVGQRCGGISLLVTDRNVVDAPELGLEIVAALRALYPAQFDITKLDQLMKNAASAKALLDGQDPRRIAAEWDETNVEFEKRRTQYLLYETGRE
jgi:uncharacterized protein YbbC (DUF1343 family)